VLGRSRIAALVAILALLLAAPFERGRACDICPVDCPMHAASGKAKRLGCHQGGGARTAPDADPDGGCAMRAGCGHHQRGVVAVFDGELPPAVVVTPHVATGPVRVAQRVPASAEPPAPPRRPPELHLV